MRSTNMHAAQHEFRATTDEAPVLVAPFHELRVSRRLRFDLWVALLLLGVVTGGDHFVSH